MGAEVTQDKGFLVFLVAARGLEPRTYGLCVARLPLMTKKISHLRRQNPKICGGIRKWGANKRSVFQDQQDIAVDPELQVANGQQDTSEFQCSRPGNRCNGHVRVRKDRPRA